MCQLGCVTESRFETTKIYSTRIMILCRFYLRGMLNTYLRAMLLYAHAYTHVHVCIHAHTRTHTRSDPFYSEDQISKCTMYVFRYKSFF